MVVTKLDFKPQEMQNVDLSENYISKTSHSHNFRTKNKAYFFFKKIISKF